MSWVDWTIVAIASISALFSLKRGFTREAISLAAWGSALFVAFFFMQYLSAHLADYIEIIFIRNVAAFVILFITTLIIGSLVGYLTSQLVKISGQSFMDRILGVAFGFTRGMIIVMVVMVAAKPFVKDVPGWQQSRLLPHVEIMEVWTRNTIEDLRQLF